MKDVRWKREYQKEKYVGQGLKVLSTGSCGRL